MEGSASAEEELERRSKFLHSLILQKKKKNTPTSASATHKVVVDEDDGDEQKKQIKTKNVKDIEEEDDGDDDSSVNNVMKVVRVRAADMPLPLQKHAFKTARDILRSMPPSPKLDSKRLALSLKKEFDSRYGAAWHCIVGKSFGSYVTHSVGGFLYFSIDHNHLIVYVLLFKTAVHPAAPHKHPHPH